MICFLGESTLRHYIIVKFSEGFSLDDEFINIKNIFKKSLSITGIHKVKFKRNIINQPYRVDLMSVVDMEEEALALFDASDVHKEWKEEYAQYIDTKIIFDSK